MKFFGAFYFTLSTFLTVFLMVHNFIVRINKFTARISILTFNFYVVHHGLQIPGQRLELWIRNSTIKATIWSLSQAFEKTGLTRKALTIFAAQSFVDQIPADWAGKILSNFLVIIFLKICNSLRLELDSCLYMFLAPVAGFRIPT